MGSLNVKRLTFTVYYSNTCSNPPRHVVFCGQSTVDDQMAQLKPECSISGAKPGWTVPEPSVKPLQTLSLTHKAVTKLRARERSGSSCIHKKGKNERKEE